MKLQHHAKTPYEQEPVPMPIVGIGSCKNSLRCRQYMTDLANGYCVQCWDRGLDKKRKVNIDKPPPVRKSRKMFISSGGNKWIM